MMNHRPFEEWLLEDKHLNSAQKRELNVHLRECAACTAIAEANLALRSARVVSPAPGFAMRFQEHLALARAAQRRRTILGSILFGLGGLALLGFLTGPTLISLIGSPAEWLTLLVTGGVFLYSMVMAAGEAGSVLLRVLSGVVPPFIWLVVLSAISGLGLLWSVSIWRIARVPQGASL
ncbi:MAG: hypothetical protein Kow002_10860 [Anaerolineales bacterium]